MPPTARQPSVSHHKAEEVADGRGDAEWRPAYPVRYAPLFRFPPEVVALAKWLFGWPGYLWPWNVVYVSVCAAAIALTNPPTAACVELSAAWIAPLWLRNCALLWIFCGGWHLLLYQLRVDGRAHKYDPAWQATGSSRFLFGDQVYDNVFWSCASGVTVWTAYEVAFLHLGALGWLPEYSDWWAHPWYSAALLLAVPIWREFHFYVVHRLIHWAPLYRTVHYLHHRNVNPGPWSGLAMHPVEHLFYFSVVLPHFLVPGHALHFFFNAQHTALTPSSGHHGFEGPICDGKLPTGSYFHYLHHRYFECNYGEATIPLDKLFGTFRDGQAVGRGLQTTGGR